MHTKSLTDRCSLINKGDFVHLKRILKGQILY